MGGYIKMTHEGGFSGIAGITWDGGMRMMSDKYGDGR